MNNSQEALTAYGAVVITGEGLSRLNEDELNGVLRQLGMLGVYARPLEEQELAALENVQPRAL